MLISIARGLPIPDKTVPSFVMPVPTFGRAHLPIVFEYNARNEPRVAADETSKQALQLVRSIALLEREIPPIKSSHSGFTLPTLTDIDGSDCFGFSSKTKSLKSNRALMVFGHRLL